MLPSFLMHSSLIPSFTFRFFGVCVCEFVGNEKQKGRCNVSLYCVATVIITALAITQYMDQYICVVIFVIIYFLLYMYACVQVRFVYTLVPFHLIG